jgi:hypothetical protein
MGYFLQTELETPASPDSRVARNACHALRRSVIALPVEAPMSKIVRYEYLGSWFLIWACCVTVILIPLAVLILLSGLVRVETEMADPEAFVEAYRAGKGRRR